MSKPSSSIAPTSGSRDDASWTPIIGLDAAYSYYPTYAQVLKEYTSPDSVPTFMVEANYEFEDARPKTLRRQEYWSLLSGAAGQVYGSRYSWRFVPMRLVSNKFGWRATLGWRNTLDSTGVAELEHVTNLFAPRPWFELVPDRGHRARDIRVRHVRDTRGRGRQRLRDGSKHSRRKAGDRLLADTPRHHRRPSQAPSKRPSEVVRPDDGNVRRDPRLTVPERREAEAHAARNERFRRRRLGARPDGSLRSDRSGTRSRDPGREPVRGLTRKPA